MAMKKDDLWMIKNIVETQASQLHFVQEEERKINKVKKEVISKRYQKVDADLDVMRKMLLGTTRAASIVDLKQQKKTRDFLLEILGWLVHQAEVKARYPDIYSDRATRKLKELFFSIFPSQEDAHDIVSRDMMDNLLGMVTKTFSASSDLMSKFNRLPDQIGATKKLKRNILKRANLPENKPFYESEDDINWDDDEE